MPRPTKDIEILNRIRRNLLIDRIASGVPATIAAREMGLDYQWVNNSCRDPAFKARYDEACDACFQIVADRMTVLHEEIIDPKTAKNVGDNLKWWLSKRKPREFGDKLIVDDGAQPKLLDILQAAVNRLIEAVPVAAQPLTAETVPVPRVSFRGDDPRDEQRP